MPFIFHNNAFIPASQPLVFASSPAFKWGDGLFETIKVYKGRVMLKELHFERLQLGMKMLQMPGDGFTREEIEKGILELCRKNDCSELARVRLAVYREAEEQTGYLIESQPLDEDVNRWNEKGLTIGIYPFARKSMDGFSNLKSANFLPYVMAGRHAKEKGWDDAILLNSENHICDSSKANLFLVKNNEFYTPALHQGCVAGVMRRFLIDELHKSGYAVHQQVVEEKDLLEADELFLSNAIFGMKWVSNFREKNYHPALSNQVYHQLPEALSRIKD